MISVVTPPIRRRGITTFHGRLPSAVQQRPPTPRPRAEAPPERAGKPGSLAWLAQAVRAICVGLMVIGAATLILFALVPAVFGALILIMVALAPFLFVSLGVLVTEDLSLSDEMAPRLKRTAP